MAQSGQDSVSVAQPGQHSVTMAQSEQPGPMKVYVSKFLPCAATRTCQPTVGCTNNPSVWISTGFVHARVESSIPKIWWRIPAILLHDCDRSPRRVVRASPRTPVNIPPVVIDLLVYRKLEQTFLFPTHQAYTDTRSQELNHHSRHLLPGVWPTLPVSSLPPRSTFLLERPLHVFVVCSSCCFYSSLVSYPSTTLVRWAYWNLPSGCLNQCRL